MGQSVLTHGVLFVVLFNIMLTAPSRAGAQPDPSTLQSWFANEWKNASERRVPDLDGKKLTWRIEEHWSPPADEISRVRAELKGHPDHPDRFLVPIWEARRAGKPTIGVRELWARGTDEWRMNMSSREDPKAYEDQVVRRDVMWAMNATALGIMSHEVPDPQYDAIVHHQVILNELRILLSGGLIYAARDGVACPRVVTTGESSWSASLSTPDAGTIQIDGEWNSTLDRGFVRHVIVKGARGSSSEPMEITAKDWMLFANGKDWIAQSVEIVKSEPRQLDRVTVFEESREQSDGEFDRITHMPEYNGEDAIRGKTTFNSIQDMRPDVRETRFQTPEGEQVRPLLPTRSTKQELSLLRTTGWATLACVVTAFLCLVIRRKAQGR